MQQTNPSGRRNRVLIWLLSVLGIVAIAAVSMVVLKFNRDSVQNSDGTVARNSVLSEEEANAAGKKIDSAGDFTISGFISELTPQKEIASKEITLVALVPNSKTGALGKVSYRFLLSSKETEGADTVKGGDSVVVHFAGAPSETSYILAKKVEVLK